MGRGSDQNSDLKVKFRAVRESERERGPAKVGADEDEPQPQHAGAGRPQERADED